MADYLELPHWSLSIGLGAIGLAVALLVIFQFIPERYRLTFIVGGWIGGSFGFYFWHTIAGPFLFT